MSRSSAARFKGSLLVKVLCSTASAWDARQSPILSCRSRDMMCLKSPLSCTVSLCVAAFEKKSEKEKEKREMHGMFLRQRSPVVHFSSPSCHCCIARCGNLLTMVSGHMGNVTALRRAFFGPLLVPQKWCVVCA